MVFERLSIAAAERSLLPDPLLRWGIRRLCRQRLVEKRSLAAGEDPEERLVSVLRRSPIAVEQAAANQQHYEVPPQFFRLVLGRHLKYSCCLWEEAEDLSAAELAMLELSCQRAEIADGMRVLDLGCGWGSLSLFVAERFPSCEIVAISNSRPQIALIGECARERGLDNVVARCSEVSELHPGQRFDRVVSIEMFEHLRNYEALLERVASWLEPDGKLFVHVFCHRELPYLFEDHGDDDWMARNFFTGGLMPSLELLRRFDSHLVTRRQWEVSGLHYRRTADAWLANLNRREEEAEALFRELYGRREASRRVQRWRLFFLACAELFGYAGGNEWLVTHSLLERRETASKRKTA